MPWIDFSGFCPVQKEEKTIAVELNEFSAIGAPRQYKVGSFKCDCVDLANSECANCPVFAAAIRTNFPH